MHVKPKIWYFVANFHVSNCYTLQDMNYFLVLGFGQVSDTRQTESDANEPTVQKQRCAQKEAEQMT